MFLFSRLVQNVKKIASKIVLWFSHAQVLDEKVWKVNFRKKTMAYIRQRYFIPDKAHAFTFCLHTNADLAEL